jgi:1-acyl-sn-glycerol-3-phosphate acyltransferase
MKIKVIDKSYEEAMAIKPPHHKKPLKPSIFFRTLMKVLAIPNIMKTHMKHERIGMEKLGKKEPALYLMNHSCFIDLEIIPTILYPRPFNIVATRDTFIGKNLLIRLIGCIPTSKFVADTTLVRDIMHAIKKQKSSVVMFPEAGYSLDGRTTVLPDSLGKLAKLLGVPVISVMTEGAFARDPLYNNLQIRKVDVKVTEKYLLSPEEIKAMTPEEINERIRGEFAFDNFKWQRENKVKIDEPFRADYLHRVLYKCPHCMAEGEMEGKGVELTCKKCGKTYILDEYGALLPKDGEGKFDHIPDWFDWQRDVVRREIETDGYSMDIAVDLYMVIDSKGLYRVGEGRLKHDKEGFVLDGCDGRLRYEQKSLACYTLNSEYFWYEIGDVISIGTHERLYYCFPKENGGIVTKARLATEEIYKLLMREKSLKS